MSGQHIGQPSGSGISSQSSRCCRAQLEGRLSPSELKQAAGHFSKTSIQGVGTGVGPPDGVGDGIIVGEHSGGDPSGERLNIG